MKNYEKKETTYYLAFHTYVVLIQSVKKITNMEISAQI